MYIYASKFLLIHTFLEEEIQSVYLSDKYCMHLNPNPACTRALFRLLRMLLYYRYTGCQQQL